MQIPASIKRHVHERHGQLDSVGCSDANVLIFDDMVLKIQKDSNAAANEHQMLRWLGGRLAVPKIIEEDFIDGMRYLLMSRIPGRYLCDASVLDNQILLADLVAEGLCQMWSVDVSHCPTNRTLDQKFIEIEAGIRQGTISLDSACQKGTYGPGGFTSPAALFDWLIKNRTEEELVLSHGDYCLPNIFSDGKVLTGFIDLGYAGVADKWIDIEKGLWSMWANTTGQFGGEKRRFDRSMLFSALNMQPDEDKLRYYSLLSELC